MSIRCAHTITRVVRGERHMNSGLVRALCRTVAVAVAGTAVTALPGPAFPATTAPPADGVTLKVYTVNGSGCPAGTTTVEQSPDNTSFHVTFTRYVASVGRGSGP